MHLIWHYTLLFIIGLVQERCNSIANALELRLSCTKSLIWCYWIWMKYQPNSLWLPYPPIVSPHRAAWLPSRSSYLKVVCWNPRIRQPSWEATCSHHNVLWTSCSGHLGLVLHPRWVIWYCNGNCNKSYHYPCWISSWKYWNIFAFSLIAQHWDGAGGWNPSSWKARTCVSCVARTRNAWASIH